MYSWKGDVPEEEYLIPLGKADVKRQGADVTLVSYGKPMRVTLEAAEKLAAAGVEAEVIDLRSIPNPWMRKLYMLLSEKPTRCVIVEESWPFASVGSHLAWLVSRNAFDYLDAPVEMVASAEVPMPYNHKLELAAQPQVKNIVDAARRVLYLDTDK